MPAWPGGPCPECGEVMPENLIHCQNCRALLNTDLEFDSVIIPEFVPLKEIGSAKDVKIRGYYVACLECADELRITRTYVGRQVQCNKCSGQFLFNPDGQVLAVYSECAHCSKRLRIATKYVGRRVTCKYCGGKIRIIENDKT